MAADKEIMKAIETLRLDRPGRVYAAAQQGLQRESLGAQLISTLTELAATFREEAGLWAKSGARGWKSSEGEAYLIAQAVDEVAAQLDNAGGGAALSVTELAGQGLTADDIEAELRESAKRIDAVTGTGASGLDRLIADSVAERRGHVRDELLPDGHPARSDHQPDGTVPSAVIAYLKGETNDIPGSAPLTPNSITPAPEADDPFAPKSTRIASLGPLPFAKSYCYKCDLDQHRCPGCGEPIEHGEGACERCAILHAAPVDIEVPECCQHMLAPDEDPAPWCDGRQDVDHDEHNGPCKYKAHLRADHDDAKRAQAKLATLSDFTATMPSTPLMLLDTPTVPPTWESETMTADGHMKPGSAPLLGQPGDAGAGYSHSYVPAGGRPVTYAELLTPVPAASLPPHLSHSQGNTIGDCATKYRLQRIEQLPQVPQWANVGGSAFHAAVEAIERGQFTSRSIEPEICWKHHFEGQIAAVSASSPVPVSVWRASRKGAEGRQWWEVNGPLMLRRYLDARPAEPSLMTGMAAAPAIEWEITADVPTRYGPLPYRAVLDRVTWDERQDAYVIRDYKTSYERPTDTTQLGDYAHVMILAKLAFPDRKFLGTYFDARRGTWTEPVDLLAEHPFEAFQYRVTTAHAQRLALTAGPTPARPSSYCGGCSVRYACPIMASKS